MRRCHKCKKKLGKRKFASPATTTCKSCKKVRDKKLFVRRQKRKAKNKPAQEKRPTTKGWASSASSKGDDKERRRCKALVRSLKQNPCGDCRNSFPPEAMDFDHLPGFKKMASVSRLAAQGDWSAMNKEIAKCELVCSNCHRVRTRKRGQ